MKLFIELIAIQLSLCVCIVTAVEFCPAGFEKVEGISQHRCFYHHMTKVPFKDALKICVGKNAMVFEPKSREEGDIIHKFVKEKRSGPWWFGIWINYQDIQRNVSMMGVYKEVILTSSYMGSLSTFDKMPIEWWSYSYHKGEERIKGEHCAIRASSGVFSRSCSNLYPLVCETDAKHNLLKPTVPKI